MRQMSTTRRRVLLGVVTWLAASALAYQIAGYQSERAVAVVRPLPEACGKAYLEGRDAGMVRPVTLQGQYVIDPRHGAVVVAPVSGSVSARVAVFRGERVVRSGEVVATAGQRLRLRTSLFRVHQESVAGLVGGFSACVGMQLPSLQPTDDS